MTGLDWINGGYIKSPHYKNLNGVWGIDVDGLYGFQCKDFVNDYAIFLGYPFTAGNAITLWTVPQKGWIKVTNPQPEDVFVKNSISQGVNVGHTGIIQEVVIGGFYSIDQNYLNPSPERGSPPARIFHTFSEVLGYLRLENQMDKKKNYPNSGDLTNIFNTTGWPGHIPNPNDIAYWCNGTGNPHWGVENDVWTALTIEVWDYGRNKKIVPYSGPPLFVEG